METEEKSYVGRTLAWLLQAVMFNLLIGGIAHLLRPPESQALSVALITGFVLLVGNGLLLFRQMEILVEDRLNVSERTTRTENK